MMKPHLTFSNRLTEQQTPEDHYNSSSSENSCTSLNEQDQDGYQQAGFQYPVDILGTSWGSYLHSGPPTRSGLAGACRRMMTEANDGQLEQGVIKKSPVKRNRPTMAATTSLRNTVCTQDTSQPKAFIGVQKDLTQISEEVSQLETGNQTTKVNVHTNVIHKYSLLKKVQSLTEMVATSKENIAKCGINTDQLTTLRDRTLRSYTDLHQLVTSRAITDDGAEVLSSGVLCEVTNYLTEVLSTLVRQSKTIQEEATFLEKTGKQLNRTQERFFKEQIQLQQAVEEDRTQLMIEKQTFDDEKAAMKENVDELRRMYHKVERVTTHTEHIPKQSSTRTQVQKSVHEVMQGRNQLVGYIQTQREQNKLEKLLLRQQRDIQQIQRELQNLKTELLSTQDHALRLQHRVTMYRSKVSLLPSQTSDDHSMKVHKGTAKTGIEGLPNINGIITAQTALDREIGRMKRQLEEQQEREKQITKQLETGYQKLKRTRHRLKQQGANIKGRYNHGDKFPQIQSESRKRKHPHQASQLPQSQSVTLPKLVPRQEERRKTKKRLPTYAFSKTELVTLARFSDEETADSVLDWLGLQGVLTD